MTDFLKKKTKIDHEVKYSDNHFLFLLMSLGDNSCNVTVVNLVYQGIYMIPVCGGGMECGITLMY